MQSTGGHLTTPNEHAQRPHPAMSATQRVTRLAMDLESRALSAVAALASTRRTAAAAERAGDPRSVLVVALGAIGDAVMLGPFLRELRRHLPAADVTLIVHAGVLSLFEHCPYPDRVVPYDTRVPAKSLRPLLLPIRAWRFAAKHRRRKLDLAILPQWEVDYHFAALLGAFADARRRVAYGEHESARREVLNAGYDRFLTDAVTAGAGACRHEVARMLATLEVIGARPAAGPLELWLTAADHGAALALLGPADEDSAPLVAFGIGANLARRRWPAERFLELGRRLTAAGAKIVAVGGPEDGAAQELLRQGLGPALIPLAGRASLRQTAAVLARCELFVGNDSGPMHLAAAGGVPVVEISCHPRGGSVEHVNAPERYGPWGVPNTVIRPERGLGECREWCATRTAHCITQIGADDVFAASMQYLHSSRGTRARHA